MRRIIHNSSQKIVDRSTVASHYAELKQRLDDHWNRLTDNQRTLQNEEQVILVAQTRLPAVQLEIAKTVQRLVAGDEWVTAEEHDRIHSRFGEAMQEREELLKAIKAARETIQYAADEAQRHAGHAIGIERALLHLRQELSSDAFPHPSNTHRYHRCPLIA